MNDLIIHLPCVNYDNLYWVYWDNDIIDIERDGSNQFKYDIEAEEGIHSLEIANNNLLNTNLWLFNAFACMVDVFSVNKKHGFSPKVNILKYDVSCNESTSIHLKVIFINKNVSVQLTNNKTVKLNMKDESIELKNQIKKRWLITNILAYILMNFIPLSIFYTLAIVAIFKGTIFSSGSFIFLILAIVFSILLGVVIKGIINKFNAFD